MTEIRTTSATGGEKGVKPQRHSLLPKHGLDVIAEVFGFGAAKYADHNWRRKYEWSKSYDALQRHLTAWWDGEDVDPESGLSHLGHAGFHILVLATWERLDGQGSEYDDRHTFNREAVEVPMADHPGFIQCPNACCEPTPTYYFDSDAFAPLDPEVEARKRAEREAKARRAERIAEDVLSGTIQPEELVQVEGGWLIPDDWEDLGFTTEEGIAEDAGFKRPVREPDEFSFDRNQIAFRRNPLYDALAERLIDWRDPAPKTLEFDADLPSIRIICGLPRFTVDSLGVTSDFDNPVPMMLYRD